jgi:hypothetical protein
MANGIRWTSGRRAIAAAICAVLFAARGAVAMQVLDRILAVVAGDPITLSDVNGAVLLGLVPPPAAGQPPLDAALEALVDRQLQLIEVNRYVPPEPPEGDITNRLTAIRARFPSDAAFDAALKETGLTEDQLRGRIRDTLRIDSYLQQRFGAAYQPSDEEITSYYRAHEADFTRNGVLRPYSEVRDDARGRLIQERSATLIRDWVAGLRRRVDVTILPK